MTRDEITEFVMQNTGGKSGLSAVGPMIEQLVSLIAWQQEQIDGLKFEVLVLKNSGED